MVPLLDLKAQYRSIQSEIDAAVARIFEAQGFILGPAVESCERAVAGYTGAAHGVGVSSGTDAILLALMAEGIGPGDEVITSPYTFFATAGCIARLGAKPVFVDIDPRTFNLDTNLLPSTLTPRSRALLPVHLYGLCADMEAILNFGEKHRLVVIEDAAQAIGAEYKGRRAGGMGHYGCFSFFPSKNLGGAGDGGLVTTNDPQKAARLKVLRNHGMDPKYYHKWIGGNFRLDALQAAVVEVKLKHLDGWTAARQRNALRYNKLFTDAGLAGGPIRLPWLPPDMAAQCSEEQVTKDNGLPDTRRCGCRHVINQYVIRCERREELRAHLTQHGVGHEVYYPVPLHLQECFRYLGYREGDFPEAERAARETLALPVFSELADSMAAEVVARIAEFYAQTSRTTPIAFL